MLSINRVHRPRPIRRTITLLTVVGTAVGLLAAPAVAAPAAPSVSDVSPASGSTAGGTKITLTGHGFTHVEAVSFGSDEAHPVDVVSSTKIKVTAPKHAAGTVYVRVHTSHGASGQTKSAKYTFVTPTNKGSIAGTVTAKSSGRKLDNVAVAAFDGNGNYVDGTETQSDGSYRIGGLRGGRSYKVCFTADTVTAGSSTGYVNECYRHVVWSGPDLPVGLDPVDVTAGHTTGGIDAALATAAAISGTVTAAEDSAHLSNVPVYVVDRSSGAVLASAVTGHLGGYRLNGLPPSNSGYAVCFDASLAHGGPSAAGYQNECYNGVRWDGFTFDLPHGLTRVPAPSGHLSSGIDASLDPAATISGTVTAADDGSGLGDVQAEVIDSTGTVVGYAYTDSTGAYSALVPPSGDGYHVCFSASGATGGDSLTGYLSQCYAATAWDGDPGNVSPGATAVPTLAGVATHHIDAALDAGAAISGRVSVPSPVPGGYPLGGVQVVVFDGSNTEIASASTDSDGNYTIGGLRESASGYYVCFDASSATGGPSAGGYYDQCYDEVAWNGDYTTVGAGAEQVPTTAGTTFTINVNLFASGAIAGKVTAATTAAPGLSGVYVEVFDAGNAAGGDPVSTTVTDDAGKFRVTGLITGSYKVCFDGGGASGGPSAAGYLDECFDNQPWNGNFAAIPAAATSLSVTEGAETSGTDTALPSAGAIAGHVSAGGTPLQSVSVYLFEGTDIKTAAVSDENGNYSLSGLAPSSTDYHVCFDGSSATDGDGTPVPGLAEQCYDGVPWDGGDLPGGTGVVDVEANQVASGIDAALVPA